MNKPTEQLAMTAVKREVSRFVNQGVVDERVLQALSYLDGYVPKETDLWDYKVEPYQEVEGLAKTVLQVVSFHNTYGGYIVYGIDEVDAGPFASVGIEPGKLNTKQLRDRIASYTGEVIDVTYVELPCRHGRGLVMGLLHVPKRPRTATPVYFGKNGPSQKGKLLFERDQAYIRFQDNCVPAVKRAELQLLFSDRNLEWDDGFTPRYRELPLTNNLPDRNVICSRLVGREGILEELWRWFGDPFAYAKVLAGDGGKGKTSIAYEFAQDVCLSRPHGLEKVVWLTGKSRQFRGFYNDYTPLPETHFSDVRSLMLALAQELAVLNEDVQGASDAFLKKQIKENLTVLPALVVVDDVDSLDLDQQKKVMELAMQVTGAQSRFLLTTRMNLTYSSDTCLQVPGLRGKDYRDLVDLQVEKFGVAILGREVKALEEATDGSPLFTESLLRLVRLGIKPDKAIAEWKGKAGDEVRRAALVREIERLTLESRRVLLALSYMIEASEAELRQVTGYDMQRFERCINELLSLFLVDSPRIIGTEPRYKIQSNTALLVSQASAELVVDPRVVEKEVKKLRQGGAASRRQGQRREVGVAINQAVALLREERAAEATETIDNALKKMKGNRDLLLMRGRCLLKAAPPRLTEARKSFKQAYDAGQRKEILYELWYQAESEEKHPNGVVEVATAALEADVSGRSEWMARRAYGYWLLAKAHKAAGNYDAAVADLRAGASDLAAVIRVTGGDEKEDAIKAACECNDESWALATARGDRNSWVTGFDVAVEAIRRGDIRNLNYYHAADAVVWLARDTATLSGGARNFLEQRIRVLEDLLEARRKHASADEMVEKIDVKLAQMRELVGREPV